MPRAQYTGDFVAWTGGAMFIGSGGGTVQPHAHYAIQIVVGAPGGLLVQDGRRGAWTPCAGAIIPSRTVHSIDVGACAWSAVVFVEPETTAGKALAVRTERRVRFLEPQDLSATMGALEQAWRDARSVAAVRDAAHHLLSSLSGTSASAPSDARVLKVIEYLRDRPDEAPSLEDVARAVHLSPSRLRHLFVEETGMPLRTYQLWRRVLRVWEFLMQGETLAGAAHAAGFSDSAHLSRTCRTMFGLAPSAMQMSGPLSERLRRPPHYLG
ncbi:helix-turn-helix domain-containing protein [Ramlibacter rhizophilus]|nr:AraC family transcriptional regulator [Ramlibacter rhizophilus]